MNHAMLASTMFYKILDQIKSSNLNFQLSLSPFSAQISLKKSLVKDRSGSFLLPPPVYETIQPVKAASSPNPTAVVCSHDEEITELQNNVRNSTNIISILEQKLGQAETQALKAFEQKKTDIEALKNSLKNSDCESKNLRKELENNRKVMKEKEKLIKHLENKCDQLTSRNKDLKAELCIVKKENKKLVSKSSQRIETCTQQTSENHNDLNQNVLRASLPRTTTSSLTSSPIDPSDTLPPSPSRAAPSATLATPPRTLPLSSRPPSPHTPPGSPPSSSTTSVEQPSVSPSYILDTISNPNPSNKMKDGRPSSSPTTLAKFSRNFLRLPPIKKCPDVCTHSPQCIIREPLPPPFPSLTFLYNEDSQYHTHMMQWSKKEFAGCGRCFSIENENYGCKDCQWLKFWYRRHGEMHGFPDIEAWIYRKYL